MIKGVVLAALLCGLVFPFSVSAQQVGGGDLTYKPKGSNPVYFSHQKHVEGKGVKCTGCHYHVFQMSTNSYKMDMSKMTKGEFCGKCHNGQRSFDANDPKNCDKCHK